MADKKISDLTAASSIEASDLLLIENAGGNSRKVTGANARASFLGWVLAGTGQTATGVYDFAVDGAKANIDFAGLASFSELLVIARLLTDGTTGVRALRVSTDNGSSFYSSAGDYKTVATDGQEASVDAFAFHGTSSTAARSLIVQIFNMKGTDKLCGCNNTTPNRLFTASASDINAVRVYNSGGGNITGGTVRVYAR